MMQSTSSCAVLQLELGKDLHSSKYDSQAMLSSIYLNLK